jgi:hypothetical protein
MFFVDALLVMFNEGAGGGQKQRPPTVVSDG